MKHFECPKLSMAQAGLEHALQSEMVDCGEVEHIDHVDHDAIASHDTTVALVNMLEHVNNGKRVPKKPPTHLAITEHVWGVLKLYYELVEAYLAGNKRRVKMLRQRLMFSAGDLGWIDAIVEYLDIFYEPGGHRIPYRRWKNLDDFVIKGFSLPCKIALIGDWGTGTSIAKRVLKRAMKHSPDALIHMGDVYYAGTEAQYRQKFRQPIEEYAITEDGNRIPAYNVPGNHDMYSGGDAYYDELGLINDGFDAEKQQRASYFSLLIDDGRWQLLSCDTAYHDHDPFTVNSEVTSVIQHEQDWLQHQVAKASMKGGRTILLSHHQPFSAFEAIGALSHKSPLDFWKNPKLLDMYRRLLKRGDIAAWFWGHEHRLAIYQDYADITFGRCIGHGAIPILTDDDPYQVHEARWTDLPFALLGMIRGRWRPHTWRALVSLVKALISGKTRNPPQLANYDNGTPIKLEEASEGIMYRHGYAVLEFTSDSAIVRYYDDENDEPMYTETL